MTDDGRTVVLRKRDREGREGILYHIEGGGDEFDRNLRDLLSRPAG